jgi:hypothetical protein
MLPSEHSFFLTFYFLLIPFLRCLVVSRLEVQYAGALERAHLLKEELIGERQTSEELKFQLDELLGREERNQEEMEAMQAHIQEQELLIRELEESAAVAQEQLR